MSNMLHSIFITNTIRRLFLCIIVLIQLSKFTQCRLTRLTVTVNSNQSIINLLSTHQWNLTYDNLVSRTSFTLTFPSCVILSNSTTVSIGGFPAAITSVNSPSITFTPSSTAAAVNYIINVNNVKNCFYSATFVTRTDFTAFNVPDNVPQRETTLNQGVTYRQGSIPNCVINFFGVTGSLSSTIQTQFSIQNTIQNSQTYVFRLKYPANYFSSTQFLTSYNLNSPPSCTLVRNNTETVISNIVSTVSFPEYTVICSLNLAGIAPAISTSDVLALRITPITNPLTSTSYASSIDFEIATRDGLGNRYDKSSSCLLQPVQLATYKAQFTFRQFINANMTPLQVQSSQNLTMRLSRFDRIFVKYSSGSIDSCTGTLEVDKSNRLQSPIIFNIESTSFNRALQFVSTGNSLARLTIFMQFIGCILRTPPSTAPIQFTFLFSATDNFGTVTSYANYMQLNATLISKEHTLNQTQVRLSITIATIGDKSDYTFTVITKQPLSSTPSILIQFPTDINITTANQTLQSCTVTVANLGIGTKSCQIVSANAIKVAFILNNNIAANTNITFTILKIQNPQRPETVRGFNMKTIYTESEPTGYVEVGTDLIKNQSYEARITYPVIQNDTFVNSFIVFTNSYFNIKYTAGVNLQNNSIIQLIFTTQIKNISLSTNSGDVVFESSEGINFTFKLTRSCVVGTIFNFRFRGITPNKTGVFPVVDLVTKFNNQTYEKTSSSVMMQVNTPFIDTFRISPETTKSITGMVSQYTITFTTVVPHPAESKLQIIFPIGTNLINGVSKCEAGCGNISTITDTSSGLTDRIQIQIVPTVTDIYSFTIVLSNITNQREVGQTPFFYFKTFTKTGSQIVEGSAKAKILNPNKLNATFVAIDDYYRSNTNLVNIQVNITNSLFANDSVLLQFKPDSYTRNLNYGGSLGCSQGTCTFQQISGVLKIWVKLTAIQVISKTIRISIFGIISNPSSLYTAIASIQVSTISSSTNNTIDSGVLNYTLDCNQNSTIISKNCRTCQSGNCTSCYSPVYFLFNSICTNSCKNQSQFQAFPGTNICVKCIAPCASCLDQINCTKCITGFFLIQYTTTCSPSCNTSIGMYVFIQNNFGYCNYCPDTNCISCQIKGVCDTCKDGYFLNAGQCQGGCPSRYYNSGGKCLLCDISCQECLSGGNLGCVTCSTGFFNYSGLCIDKCVNGTVKLLSGICGCEGQCDRCVNSSTKCLSCLDSTQFFYNFSCYDLSCPAGTYAIGQECKNCLPGCTRCTSTTCMECVSNFSIFQNKCFQDCKIIGQRYVEMEIDTVTKCVQCPDGCFQCNSTYDCFQCLPEYYLNETVCKRQCELTNTCDALPYVDPIIPLPGFIAFGLWTIIIVLLKIFLLKGTYVPYSLLFGGALIQYLLVVITLAETNRKIISLTQSTSRLLQQQVLSDQIIVALGLLAVMLALNYVMNLIFIYIFCKYIKPMILGRQIDRISNYVVLVFSLLSSYRFYLMAFSRLFKKPSLQVKSDDKLRVIHIFIGVSYLLDLQAFVAAILLIANTKNLSILFMLGIDLILITIFLWIIYIWVLIKPKQPQYFTETKKCSINQHYITQQGSLNNQKQASKAKLQGTNEKIQVQDFNGSEEFDSIPTKQPNLVKIVGKKSQTINAQDQQDNPQRNNQSENPKTRRKQKGKNANYETDKKFFKPNSNRQYQQKQISPRKSQANVNQKNLVGSSSYRSNKQPDGQDNNRKNNKNKERINSQSVMQKSKALNIRNTKQQQDYEYEFDKQKPQGESQHDYHTQNNSKPTLTGLKQKPNTMRSGVKPNAQRSSTMRMQQGVNSMKKKNYASFQSQLADSNIDQVDLESIIQTRVVDRSKNKQKGEIGDTRTEGDKNQKDYQYEQISPSWFNIQNQRYDVQDKDDQ